MNETINSAERSSRSNSLLPSAAAREKMRKKRDFKDKLSRWGITYAGYGVVFALAMIFVYLFYEVMPIFKGASVTPQASYSLPVTQANTQHLVIERYQQLGIQYTDDGLVTFFEADDGQIREQIDLPLPEQTRITSFAHSEYISRMTARGLNNGQVLISKHGFDTSFPDDRRLITPKVDYPFGEQAITVDEQGQAIDMLAIETVTRGAGGTLIAA